MSDAIIITGNRGGLGQAMMEEFSDAGYTVIGIDREPAPHQLHPQICVDLGTLSHQTTRDVVSAQLKAELAGHSLKALVNNAAVQHLQSLENLSDQDLLESLKVNTMAPLVLGRMLLSDLENAVGTIINISSIHASQTKSNFGAYSISKAALSGLSRAMAVEWGERVRVIDFRPAAIATEMLEAGFKDKPIARRILDEYHPTGRIGTREEIARMLLSLIELEAPFLNGAVINADGGISHLLHDPDGR